LLCDRWSVEGRRPAKAIWNALSGAFRRIVQRRRPVPVGSRLVGAIWTHFNAAAFEWKWPRARAALWIRAFTLSIAFVLQMTSRISTSMDKRGTLSAQVSDHSVITAGYLVPRFSENSRNRALPYAISNIRRARVLRAEQAVVVRRPCAVGCARGASLQSPYRSSCRLFPGGRIRAGTAVSAGEEMPLLLALAAEACAGAVGWAAVGLPHLGVFATRAAGLDLA
jgi:hypothetical protein